MIKLRKKIKILYSYSNKHTLPLIKCRNFFCQNQEMVKLLTTKAKIEKTDRYKRTALTHATMNGSASVVSYLLSRGANPNRADTSGLGFYIFV